jgi:hypothetical protein
LERIGGGGYRALGVDPKAQREAVVAKTIVHQRDITVINGHGTVKVAVFNEIKLTVLRNIVAEVVLGGAVKGEIGPDINVVKLNEQQRGSLVLQISADLLRQFLVVPAVSL